MNTKIQTQIPTIPPPPPIPKPLITLTNPEFKRILNLSIPIHENILHDYSCAYSKEVLIQGRLYITNHHLAFKGWLKDLLFLDFSDIILIQKKSLAFLLIPNSILIQTSNSKYFFTSFFCRDEVFDILVSLWNSHVDPYSLFRKYPVLKNISCVCSTLIDTCDVCLAKHRLELRFDSESGVKSKKLHDSQSVKKLPIENLQSFGITRSHSAPITSDSSCNCSPLDSSKLILDSTLPISIDTFHQHLNLLSRSSGGWYILFCIERKITDIKVGPWVSKQSSSSPVPLEDALALKQIIPISQMRPGLHRTITYIMPLNTGIPFAPKNAFCRITQTIEAVGSTSICVIHKTETPNVPNGTQFYAEGRICLSKTSRKSTRICISYRVIFPKPNFLKSQISKATLSQTDKFFNDFEKFIKKSLDLPADFEKPVIASQKSSSNSSKTYFIWIFVSILLILQTYTLLRLLHVVGRLKDKIDSLELNASDIHESL